MKQGVIVDGTYDIIIVGSGAGGATLAKELTARGEQVLVLETGRRAERLGTLEASYDFYDGHRTLHTPATSKEGVILWRTLMAGGSTVVSCGNGLRCLQEELETLGVDLDHDLAEAESELGTAPIAPDLVSPGSERLRDAAASLGHSFEPMPKVIDPTLCSKCSHCVLGCTHDAKWTATRALDEAVAAGAQVRYSHDVQQVLVEGGRARGVRSKGPTGLEDFEAATVVLAAGGLGTPVILQRSGIEAGEGLFVDLLVNTYGVVQGSNLLHEPTMALVDASQHEDRGFILSPYVNHSRRIRLIEAGVKAAALPTADLLGVMTKITDQPAGRVYADGSVSKPVTSQDRARLDEGAFIAQDILVAAGADPRSVVVSKPEGAHPGGTAALGTVVGSDLQTRVKGLFVCDASVLPEAPGLPPIVTIVALGKYLGRVLAA